MMGTNQFGIGVGVIDPREENNTCWTGVSDDYPAIMHTKLALVAYSLLSKVYVKTYLSKANVV